MAHEIITMLQQVNWNILFLMAFSFTLLIMVWKRHYPDAEYLERCSTVVNSRGGNIIILFTLSIYFFTYAMKIFYLLFDYSRPGPDGQPVIRQDNAFALMAVQFVTATAFGGSFGAMLKTMTGENSKSRVSDSPPNPGKGGVNEALPKNPEAPAAGDVVVSTPGSEVPQPAAGTDSPRRDSSVQGSDH